jgi:D-amino-acid dehydrogenase
MTSARRASSTFRSQQSFDTGTDNYRFLAEHGLPIEIVGRDRLIEIEPGLPAPGRE